MAPADIRDAIHRRPFQPFRVHVTGGIHYDVRDPAAAMVGSSVFCLGLKTDPALPFFDDPVLVELRHVPRIEPLSNL